MDEIQSIPRVLLQDFSKTINFLSKELNIDFILMSATIPAIKNFLEKDITSELLDNKYFSIDFNKKYILKFDKKINNIECLAQRIVENLSKNNSILCVVNTRKTALSLFENLKGKLLDKSETLYLLSANFITLHREKILKEVSGRLSQKKKTILISTQIIETGVDLDFNMGFREFAPLSSIIQSAGRVNREREKKNAIITVTNKIGGSPYHEKDVSFEEISQLLKFDIKSNCILKFLKEYFDVVIKKTSPDTLLIEKMKNLDFEDVAKIFKENFMKQLPYIASVFIESEEGLYKDFVMKRESILTDLKKENISFEEKMEKKILLKEINKEIYRYIIQVPEKETNYFSKIWEGSEIYYCPHCYIRDEIKYSRKTGWISKEENNMW